MTSRPPKATTHTTQVAEFARWLPLGIGLILLVGLLFALVHLAAEVDQDGFPKSASFLRGLVAAECIGAAVGVAVVRLVTRTRFLRVSAALIWLMAIIDFLLIAQAGVIPR